ncbi:Gfo/Idh/MocA family oxidoreductase [Gammaproteobacteria bacterium]|nr:Gfo/Idh/MocA family oxidoreductase [Gammaproteobacteria bacterium]
MKIIQIGYGAWGAKLARAIKDSPYLDLVGIHTRKPIENTLYFNDLDKALDDRTVQGVIIATPLKDRHKLIMRCLDAGKHVLTEKPLAQNAAFAKSLIKKAQDQNLTLYTNYTHAHSLLISMLREKIDNQKINFIKIIMTQSDSVYSPETVSTLLFSHILAILFDISSSHLLSISIDSKVVQDKNQIIVEANNLYICANTKSSVFTRVIEINTDDKLVLVDFSNNGFLSVFINGVTTERFDIDQSENLTHVFKAFYTACQSGEAANYDQAISVQKILDQF